MRINPLVAAGGKGQAPHVDQVPAAGGKGQAPQGGQQPGMGGKGQPGGQQPQQFGTPSPQQMQQAIPNILQQLYGISGQPPVMGGQQPQVMPQQPGMGGQQAANREPYPDLSQDAFLRANPQLAGVRQQFLDAGNDFAAREPYRQQLDSAFADWSRAQNTAYNSRNYDGNGNRLPPMLQSGMGGQQPPQPPQMSVQDYNQQMKNFAMQRNQARSQGRDANDIVRQMNDLTRNFSAQRNSSVQRGPQPSNPLAQPQQLRPEDPRMMAMRNLQQLQRG